MLVKLNQAHRFAGETTDHPRFPARSRGRYQPGDVLEMPAEYYERYLEPYGFAEPYNLHVASKDATGALLNNLPVEQLRELAKTAGILDDIAGSGPNGRVMAVDLVGALSDYGQRKAQAAGDGAADREEELNELSMKELTAAATEAGIYDAIDGSGRRGKPVKKDLVDALVAWEQAGPVEGAEENGEDS